MDDRSSLWCIYVVMRTILTISIFIISLGQTSAQTMRDVWLSMPDTIVPYLDAFNRFAMIEAFEKEDGTSVTGKLQESSCIDMLTTEYMSVLLNSASTMQMRLLPTNADTVVCVVRTFYAPQAESEIAFYSTRWEKLSQSFVERVEPNRFFRRPETMSESRFAELVSIWKDCMMVRATLDAAEPVLILQCSSPIATRDEQKEIQAALVRISLKWNGKSFN